MVEHDQRHSVEYIQALGLRVIQGKNFKDTAKQLFTSPTTAMRRFGQLAPRMLEEVVALPEVIAIDEYKGDTNGERFQV
ncbi:mobile element protein [Geomicrobium sp. JCM 19037]|nr:mobile element protein [Geomicrobium sp. JCM 19037]